jgi:hypothetical protein
MKIGLVRDCLDKRVVDCNGRKMGRVDGIVIDMPSFGRPRVVYIEIGPTTLARRLPRSLCHWFGSFIHTLTGSRATCVSVAWSKISIARNEVVADLDSNQTDALLFEHWVRDRIIRRIPGA